MTQSNCPLPQIGFLRLKNIIGDPKSKPPIPPIVPVSRATFMNGVKKGIYPSPVKMGGNGRLNAWKVEDILTLIKELGGGEALCATEEKKA